MMSPSNVSIRFFTMVWFIVFVASPSVLVAGGLSFVNERVELKVEPDSKKVTVPYHF
jgi:hypothetical protein